MTSISASHALVGAIQTAGFSSRACQCGVSWPAVSYTLPAGQAMTVQARRAGALHVSQGRLWVTFSHANQDLVAPAGDHFLECGDRLQLAAGQTVVIEPWAKAAPGRTSTAPSACIRWEAAAPRRLSASLRRAFRWTT